jgi:hypothetical protein
LADHPTTALAYDLHGEAHLPVLKPRQETGGTVQVWPNPFGAEGVTLQWPSDVTPTSVQIFDASGLLVYENNPNGIGNIVRLPASLFRQAGTYTYRLGCPDGVRSGKLVYVP